MTSVQLPACTESSLKHVETANAAWLPQAQALISGSPESAPSTAPSVAIE